MQVDSSRVICVLQGEVAAVNAERDNVDLIKTPIPTTCTVVTLYNKTRKIVVMAHIDDYTDVMATINKIELLLRGKFATTLTASSFKATVLGGTDDSFSREQKLAIIEALSQVKIPVESIELPPKAAEKPQIAIDARNGKLAFSRGNKINIGLEYVQLREYGAFNTFLDKRFGSLPGVQIPYFEAREATLRENQVPKIVYEGRVKSDWVPMAQVQEALGRIHVDITPERTEVPDKSLSRARVSKLVTERFSVCEALMNSLTANNYNLMLRQTAADPKYIDLFKLLLDEAPALPVALTSSGTKSGTVWDVAEKTNNAQALTLLKKR